MKIGVVHMRVFEHFSSSGRSLGFRYLNGPAMGVQRGYGVCPSDVIHELARDDLGEGAVYEVTMRLIKSGKAGKNPYQRPARRRRQT